MSSSIPSRTSTRRRLSPPRYEEEQATIHAHATELLNLRRALQASLTIDNNSDSISDLSPSSSSSSEDEKDEKEQTDHGWSTDSVDINVPPFNAPTGKQHQARQAASPLQFFQLFLPITLMQQLADYTTTYAHYCGEHHTWRTTPEELYAFCAAHIFMGIVKLPKWHMYWNEFYQQPFLSALFLRDRFEQLLRYFRVAPHTPSSHSTTPLSDVLPLSTSLQHSFPRMYHPSRYLTLDEAMVAFKGRSTIKQYIPSKPHKWGYKIYCLASDDYLLHFELYEGKQQDNSPFETVMRMTRTYQHQQHVLFIDSWFTSPTLLDALKQQGIRICGSVRRNRTGMPKISKKEAHSLQRGEWIHRQKGDTCLVVWKDRKAVYILYNHQSPNAVASLKRWNDSGVKVSIGCPKAVHDYFFHSRSVDVCGQLHYSYPPGRKSRRPWLRLAWWLIDMCIVNAYTLYSMDQQGVTHITFRDNLMHALADLFHSNRMSVQASRGVNTSVALASDHYSIAIEEKRNCVVCSRQSSNRVQTHFICSACRVHVCVGKCFAHHHA